MGAQSILLLGAGGLTAYRCRRGAASVEARFAHCADDFAAYLRGHAGDVFCLLVDTADESFEVADIPHVRGWGRTALMTRKMERHCHGSPLCAALPQGRQTAGRRDDRILFASLTGARFVEPWLRKLEEAAVALRGVYSMSQVAAMLAGRVGQRSFVLTALTHAGLRQTFVADGRLRFSRLTALPPDSLDAAAAACAHEAASLRRYLDAQRLVERAAILPVVVLAHPEQIGSFRRRCVDGDELSFDFLNLVAETARRGLPAPTDSRSDALFAGMLAGAPPRRQFAPEAARRRWRLHGARRLLDACGAAALAASLAFAALRLPGLIDARDATARLRADNDVAEKALQISMQGRPSSPSAMRELRDLAIAHGTLQRASPGPAPLLGHLGQALDGHPEIELDALEWRLADQHDQAGGPVAILDVRGRFPSGSDPRGQRDEIDRLIARLRGNPAVSALVMEHASAMDPSRILKSSDPQKSDADFVLRVAQRL